MGGLEKPYARTATLVLKSTLMEFSSYAPSSMCQPLLGEERHCSRRWTLPVELSSPVPLGLGCCLALLSSNGNFLGFVLKSGETTR